MTNSEVKPISPRELFYHRERLRNRVFDCVLKALAERVRLGQTNKATIAKRLGKDPAQVNRWLGGPSNWTIDTISDLMLSLEAELRLDHYPYEDAPKVNFKHYLAVLDIGHGATSKTFVLRPSENVTERTESGTSSTGPALPLVVLHERPRH
jgi:hypothetical protein